MARTEDPAERIQREFDQEQAALTPGARLAAIEAANAGTELTPQEREIAAEIAATRADILRLARNPGFSGISKTIGAASLDAVLEDLTRAVARKLIPANTGARYSRFLDAAKGA